MEGILSSEFCDACLLACLRVDAGGKGEVGAFVKMTRGVYVASVCLLACLLDQL